MRCHLDPVDAYAKLKSDIRDLEAQAAVLRESFLRPGAHLRSNRHEVVIRQQSRRTFQKDLLPVEVLNDPRYWLQTTSAIVTVRPMGVYGNVLKNNDEISLLEPF